MLPSQPEFFSIVPASIGPPDDLRQLSLVRKFEPLARGEFQSAA